MFNESWSDGNEKVVAVCVVSAKADGDDAQSN